MPHHCRRGLNGEWRYFPGDKWHNPHWDNNPHKNPYSEWDNIPINGLPPRIGAPIPAPTPQSTGPDTGSGITMPQINIPTPSPAASGPAVVAGGGALLILILGVLALA